MPYEKLPPIKGGVQGCLNCGFVPDTLPMDAVIAVGFGYAAVTKNGKEVYDENEIPQEKWDNAKEYEEVFWTTQDAERPPLFEPDADWRIHLVGPLSERHFSGRAGLWYCIRRGKGFLRNAGKAIIIQHNQKRTSRLNISRQWQGGQKRNKTIPL